MAIAIAVTADATVLDIAGSGPATLFGWSINASAAAVWEIRVGSASGAVIATGSAATAGNQTVWFGPQGVQVAGDIVFELVSGTVSGAVFVG